MSRTKIAPTLQANILLDPPDGWEETEPLGDMRRELQALLAVARAADGLISLVEEIDWTAFSVSDAQKLNAARRAMAHLRKVSKP